MKDEALKFDKEVLHKNGIIDPTKDMSKCFDWNKEDIALFFKTVFSKEVLNIPPMKNASEVIKKLRADGHYVVMVTSRNKAQMNNPYEITREWLRINDIVVDKIIVGAKYKGPIIEEQKIDLFIDESRIIIENESKTTEENNINIMNMLNLKLIDKPTKMVLITHEVHLLRIILHWSKILNNNNIQFYYDYFEKSKLSYDKIINNPALVNELKRQVEKTKKFINDGEYVDIDISNS